MKKFLLGLLFLFLLIAYSEAAGVAVYNTCVTSAETISASNTWYAISIGTSDAGSVSLRPRSAIVWISGTNDSTATNNHYVLNTSEAYKPGEFVQFPLGASSSMYVATPSTVLPTTLDAIWYYTK